MLPSNDEIFENKYFKISSSWLRVSLLYYDHNPVYICFTQTHTFIQRISIQTYRDTYKHTQTHLMHTKYEFVVAHKYVTRFCYYKGKYI